MDFLTDQDDEQEDFIIYKHNDEEPIPRVFKEEEDNDIICIEGPDCNTNGKQASHQIGFAPILSNSEESNRKNMCPQSPTNTMSNSSVNSLSGSIPPFQSESSSADQIHDIDNDSDDYDFTPNFLQIRKQKKTITKKHVEQKSSEAEVSANPPKLLKLKHHKTLRDALDEQEGVITDETMRRESLILPSTKNFIEPSLTAINKIASDQNVSHHDEINEVDMHNESNVFPCSSNSLISSTEKTEKHTQISRIDNATKAKNKEKQSQSLPYVPAPIIPALYHTNVFVKKTKYTNFRHLNIVNFDQQELIQTHSAKPIKTNSTPSTSRQAPTPLPQNSNKRRLPPEIPIENYYEVFPQLANELKINPCPRCTLCRPPKELSQGSYGMHTLRYHKTFTHECKETVNYIKNLLNSDSKEDKLLLERIEFSCEACKTKYSTLDDFIDHRETIHANEKKRGRLNYKLEDIVKR